jgi:hypothetical protein
MKKSFHNRSKVFVLDMIEVLSVAGCALMLAVWTLTVIAVLPYAGQDVLPSVGLAVVGWVVYVVLFDRTWHLRPAIRDKLGMGQPKTRKTSAPPLQDKSPTAPCYVYVVQAGEFYKIGMTRGDVDKRLAQLQTGSPRRLKLIKVIETDNPARMERTLHAMLQHKRGPGEWFKLDADDLDILKRIQ